ncbi:MAG: UbiA family prenyltransferase [Chloroflexota bacterium]|nr:UbiA family prenyltransferase [Chloroflexota bacterium]
MTRILPPPILLHAMMLPPSDAVPRRSSGAASPARWRRAARIVHAYLVLPHAVPVLVVLGTTAAFAMLAADGVPAWESLARLLLAMLGGQLAIGAINEVADAELDAVSKPNKPIPAGYVSVRAALVLACVSLLVMLWFSAGFGLPSLLLCALGTGAGLAYDLWFKRTLFSWLPYLIALPLLPVWVWTAIAPAGFDPRLLALYPLGAFAVVGVHLSQALPDTVGDRAAGIRSLSSSLGERRAIVTCWLATLSTPLLAVAAAPLLVDQLGVVWLAAMVVALLVGLDIALYTVRRRLGVMACFPCVAVSTAVMGLGWVLALR